MLQMLMILKILKEPKMKFYQMKMTDVVQTTEFEIARVEFFKTVIDAVSLFVVAVALIAYLIDFRFDAVVLIAVVLIAVTEFLVFDIVMKAWCWSVDISFNFAFVKMFVNLSSFWF